jgi:lysophospholipase L1-like esterase
MTLLAWLIALFLLALALYVGFKLYRVVLRRPATYPTPAYLQRRRRDHPDAPRLVCLGDSITQGDMGASYVRLLEQRLAPAGWVIFNAGINGDLSSNALARVDAVLAAQPTAVTLLIGTNNLHATMSAPNYASYVRLGKTHQPVTFEGYQADVAEIVRRLQQATTARIALVSIPLMSEDVTHAVNRRGDEYSAYLQALAGQLHVVYLPLREAQKAYLQSTGKKGGPPYENTEPLMTSAMIWSFLGMSPDWIAARIGNQFTIDNLHSNTRAAGMIADVVEKFVRAG